MLPIRSINKVATEEDILKEIETYKHEKKVETLCNDLITKYNLEMTLTHVEFTQFGKKAVFYFIAPARVDFRDLVKDLVNELKMRIELRQISVRDRSASVGGIGPCGRELCCSSFLSKYGAVNVKMAKNQDLTINYSKLNGVCGQLKCCLQYEDEVYAEKRKKLPEEGAVIETYTGEIGVVRRLNILSEQFDILTTSGVIKRFVVEEFKDYRDDFKMPEQFDHITDETKTINGLERSTNLKEKNKEHDRVKAENRGKEFAKKAFTEIFGAETLDYSLPEVAELLSSKAVPMKNLEEELPAHINKDEDFEDLEPQTQPQKTNPQNNNNNHNHNRNNNTTNRNNNRNHNRR
jgi:cell fate regulator YaaT (PSP1 superfamily)